MARRTDDRSNFISESKKSHKHVKSMPDPPARLSVSDAPGDANLGSESESEAEKSSEELEHDQKPHAKSQGHNSISAADVRAAREANETFKSNVFKLQVDEVLKEIAVDEKYASQARKLLFMLREKISMTTAVGPVAYNEAQKSLTTRIPFPCEAVTAADATDIKYKFGYAPPELDSINVIGSWSLHTSVRRPSQAAGIDLMVPMAAVLFDAKDCLNFRYHRKRAFFLAVLASQLADQGLPFDLRFENFNGHPLRPTLLLTPTGKLGKRISVYIHACPEQSVCMPLARLAPHKNANRAVEGPTPVYNWSILSDICAMPVLRFLHATAAAAPAFTDAVKLGALWLHQRRWASDPLKGGFGVFEFAILVATLLNTGSAGGKRRLLPGYSSYQLFKGALLYIAESEAISLRAQLVKGSKEVFTDPLPHGIVFTDTGLNVLANLAAWAPKLLRHDAQLSVDMLNDGTRDRFENLLLQDCSKHHLRFDITFEITLGKDERSSTALTAAIQDVHTILNRAWGERYKAMQVIPKKQALQGSLQSSWPLSSDTPESEVETIMASAVLDPNHADRRVTFVGPEHEHDPNLFNEFWGPKASLRRFQDGSIKDAVVWTPSQRPVILEAAAYALKRHLDAGIKFPQLFESKLPSATGSIAEATKMFTALSTSFQKLGQTLQELRGALPLNIISVYGTSADLRSASITEPQPFVPTQVSEGIIEMETSTRWPLELEAAEKVKSAFLIKIAETMRKLHPQYYIVIGLESSPEDPTVEGAFAVFQTPDGFYFKLRIYARVPRVPPTKLSKLADHTRLISTMVNRFPGSLSAAMRLVKYWFQRQLLTTYISEPAIELLTLHCFVNSSPYAPPVSPTTAFWRTIDLLRKWNWRESSLILDTDRHIEDSEHYSNKNQLVTGCDMNLDLFQALTAAFTKQRKQDPALTQAPWVISTVLDESGIYWTSWEPRSRIAAVIASRVTTLAHVANPEVNVFEASTSDFDLIWEVTAPAANTHRNKNMIVSDPHKAIIGAHHIAFDLVDALKNLYKDSLLLFYLPRQEQYNAGLSKESRDHLLCGVWNPQALAEMPRLKANIPYPVKNSRGHFELDKDAVVHEIERLGAGMLVRIK